MKGSKRQAKSLELRDIEAVCESLCKDYFRRRRVVVGRLAERRIVMEYAYINSRIFDAASEIVGVVDAEKYIDEIGRRIGYAKSEIDSVSETTYKINKERIKVNILRKIYYIDSYSDLSEFADRTKKN